MLLKPLLQHFVWLELKVIKALSYYPAQFGQFYLSAKLERAEDSESKQEESR